MTPAAGGEACVTGYEALRPQLLGLGLPSGTSAGLLVLLGQGLAAWIARLSPAPEPPPPPPPVDPRHAALVRVLASMALAVGKQARA